MATVRKELMARPRHRHRAVIEFCLTGDHRSFTDEDASQTLVIQIVDFETVTIQDDANTLAEIRQRAKEARGGQPTLEDTMPPETGDGLGQNVRELGKARRKEGGQ